MNFFTAFGIVAFLIFFLVIVQKILRPIFTLTFVFLLHYAGFFNLREFWERYLSLHPVSWSELISFWILVVCFVWFAYIDGKKVIKEGIEIKILKKKSIAT